ncbi:MAG: MarR family winged helix-turn-helix transcriptional regulator [Planctomycetota bacterium]|jgi:DNA-binding MarR family transcriptional regulator
MGPDLEQSIHELSLRMRLIRAQQDDEISPDSLTEREELIIRLLHERGKMTVSEIAAAAPHVSYSTISTTITKLWRKQKMVSKTISPESQRVTIIELTKRGVETANNLMKKQSDRYKTLITALGLSSEEKDVLYRIINRAVTFFDKHMGISNGIT